MKRQPTRFRGVYTRISERRRKDGKPDVCYDITYKVNGRKIWEKVGWKSEGYTAALADEIRSERLRNSRHGDLPVQLGREITFGEAWKEYDKKWIAIKVKNPKPDRCRYNLHLEQALAHLPLSRISPFDLEKLKILLQRKDLSPQTVHHCLSLVRRVINKAISWDLWRGVSPTMRISFPTVDNQRLRWLTPDEAKELLSEIHRRSLQWYRISVVSLHTGMRPQEIFRLRPEHLDLQNGHIQVLDSKAGSRTAYMTPTVRQIFEEMQPGKSGLVFKNRLKKEITAVSETVTRAIEARQLNQGVTDTRNRVVFYTWRHTFASWLAKAGHPLYLIAELMGHSEIEMTRRYSHLCPDQKEQAVQQIEDYFNNAIAGRASSRAGNLDTVAELFEDIK